MKRLATDSTWWQESPTLSDAVMVPQRGRPAVDHIGIDVGMKSSQICELTEAGEIVERQIRTERKRLQEVFVGRPQVRILMEASTESEWIAGCLEELGHEVIVADPNFAPMLRASESAHQDRSPRRARLGGRLSTRGLSAGPSDLSPSARRARGLGDS